MAISRLKVAMEIAAWVLAMFLTVRTQLAQQVFQPLIIGEGPIICATDTPSSVASLLDMPGFPDGVPASVKCGFLCTGLSGCVGFNHLEAPYGSTEGEQCELFTFIPEKCTKNASTCRYYQKGKSKEACRPYSEFDLVIATNQYYKPINASLSWGDATKVCADLSPYAHLLILDSRNEYNSLVAYLETIPSSLLARCKNPAFASHSWYPVVGFWTAKRRRNEYVASQQECDASPFVWIKDNTTAGMLPTKSWENDIWSYTLWPWREPSCSADLPTRGMMEACTALNSLSSYGMYDLSCYYSQCPLCQLDVD